MHAIAFDGRSDTGRSNASRGESKLSCNCWKMIGMWSNWPIGQKPLQRNKEDKGRQFQRIRLFAGPDNRGLVRHFTTALDSMSRVQECCFGFGFKGLIGRSRSS